ncbi:MAG: hypothetical protein J1E60_06755 [Christensenellaceae bacterium]|nr:hypothetical protein [Christensenellaceae bacterium]
METVNRKVKLFDRAFMMEMFRALLPLGVVFAVLELLGAFNIVNLASVTMGIQNTSSVYSGYITLYFALAGYIAAAKLRKKHFSNLYGCIPLAKRTIWGSSLLAALMWGAVVVCAHIAGYALFWGVIAKGINSFSTVPPSHYEHILSLLRVILTGIAAYGAGYLFTSVTGGTVSLLVALFSTLLCLSFVESMLFTWSLPEFSLTALLLPVHPSMREIIDWIWGVLLAAGLLIASYFAFIRSRAESIGKPAGSKALHIAIGTIIGLCACFIASTAQVSNLSLRTDLNGTFDPFSVPFKTIIIPILIGLIVYGIYMCISRRSFKNGLRMLAFYPITIVVFVVTAFLSTEVVGLDNSVVIDFDTLDCAFVAGNASELFADSAYYGYYDSDYGFLGGDNPLDEVSCKGIGADGEQYYELRDPRLLETIVRAYKEGELYAYYENGLIDAAVYGWFGIDSQIVVRLKDGRHYTLIFYPSSEMGMKLRSRILKDDGYVDMATDMTRFENAHIATPAVFDGRINGESLAETLLNELRALTPSERAKVFGMTAGDRYFVHYGSVFIASPMNKCMQLVYLTDLTPKSSALYMRLCNEYEREKGTFEYLENAMAERKIDSAAMTLIGKDGSVLCGGIYSEEHTQRQLDYISELLKNGASPTESENVLFLYDWYTCEINHAGAGYLISNETKIYIGISDEKLAEIIELFGFYKPEEFPPTEVEKPDDDWTDVFVLPEYGINGSLPQ